MKNIKNHKLVDYQWEQKEFRPLTSWAERFTQGCAQKEESGGFLQARAFFLTAHQD